jgi:hypothetical protein
MQAFTSPLYAPTMMAKEGGLAGGASPVTVTVVG